MEANSLKCSSIQTVRSIDLKFGIHNTSHRPAFCVDFGEFRINTFFSGVQKRINVHYSPWNQTIRIVRV